jgi:putative FmdB family regulatory protein
LPIYTFRCQKCGKDVEVEHRFDEPHPTQHGKCGGWLFRVYKVSEIVFKGSGFYSTDNRLEHKPEEK